LIDRRTLIKAGLTTALLASINWDKAIRTAAETVASGAINIIWFEAAACDGDTESAIQATDPDLIQVLLGKSHVVPPGTVALRFQHVVMPEWGERALEVLHLAAAGRLDPFVLVLEGAVPPDEKAGAPPGSDMFCFVGEENGKPITCLEWMRRLLPRAVAFVSVGNCASYGGFAGNYVWEKDYFRRMGFDYFDKFPSGYGKSPTGNVGFFDDKRRGHKGLVHLLPEAEPFRRFIDGECVPTAPGQANCRPAVAVPGCPANGNGILKTVANLVLWVKGLMPLPELDEFARPKFIFGPTVHENCPRAAWYAAGDFRKTAGENNAKCLYAVGCKGPVAHCPWNRVGWINGVGGPTRTGGVCIGCTEPGFMDAFEPYYQKLPYVPASYESLKMGIGIGVAGLLAAGAIAGALSAKKEEGEEGKVETREGEGGKT
jgi:hydrogenase small subunit